MSAGWRRLVVFMLCMVPLGLILFDAASNQLGAEPIKEMTHRTGIWTLRLLLVTLTVSPLVRLANLKWLMIHRRMLGLFVFFYGFLHFMIYLWLDLYPFWSQVVDDIVKRPYITVGFTALMLLIPLAVTSNRAMMRRLGKSWKKLHRLVYLIAILGTVHFIWLVKADLLEPSIYAAILALLLGYRMANKRRARPGISG